MLLFAWDKQLSMAKIQGIGLDTDQLALLSILSDHCPR